jgi:tRNA A37 threonylcarbamoyladenosine dehydratase
MCIWKENVNPGIIKGRMANPFERLNLLAGNDVTEALEKSHVIVAGLGGVGSWCAEALVRSGIGSISIVDFDTICVSNINRQVQASSKNIGRLKTEALEERLRDINPSCRIVSFPCFFSSETAELFDICGTDFVIDAIDILKSKLDLIETSLVKGKKLFSSMGMALKLDPTLIRTADIWETSGCPLARLVRQGLKKRSCHGHFTAVYSPERLPRCESAYNTGENEAPGEDYEPVEKFGGKKIINGSAVMVTATAGMVLASLVIRDLYLKASQ